MADLLRPDPMLAATSREKIKSLAMPGIRVFGLIYIFITGMAIAINSELGEKFVEATIVAWLPLLFVPPKRRFSNLEYWWMAIAGLTALSAWISFYFHSDLDRAKSMTEVYSKYLLPFFYLVILRRIDFTLNHLKIFFILVSVCAGATAIYESLHIEDRGFVTHGRPILFGGIALVSGWLSLLLITSASAWHAKLLSLFAFAAGAYTAFFSQSRGVWIAIPVLLILPFLLSPNKKPQLKAYGLPLAAVAIVGTLLLWQFTAVFEQRIGLAVSDIISYQTNSQAGAQTSAGARLEMWKASMMIFKEYPWWGVGIGDVPIHLSELAQQGQVSEVLVQDNYTHMHNEFFHVLATRGLIGLLTLMAMMLWLFLLFKRNLALHMISDKLPGRVNAGLCHSGLALLVACTIYSLTDSFFSSNIGAGFFMLGMTLIIKILADSELNSTSIPALKRMKRL